MKECAKRARPYFFTLHRDNDDVKRDEEKEEKSAYGHVLAILKGEVKLLSEMNKSIPGVVA